MKMRLLTVSLFISAAFFSLLIFRPSPSQAQEVTFTNNLESSFRLHDEGHATVVHKVTLETSDPNFYPDTFTFQVDPKSLDNFVVNAKSGPLRSEETNEAITVFLPTPGGDSNQTTFEMKYSYLPAAERKGHLWEISLPVFVGSENIQLAVQKFNVIVPESWGKLQSSFPAPARTEEFAGESVYVFEVNNNSHLPELHLVFGAFQLYDVQLRYPLSNSNAEDTIFVVTFPPSIAGYQKVFVKSIEPSPDSIELDADGNILGRYLLKPGDEKMVTFMGQTQVQIPNELPASSPQLEEPGRYTMPDMYWESNAPQIQELAAQLKTPSAVYEYVTSNFKYDESRVQSGPVERYGAERALNSPAQALCMEFTDATIALLRAANVPAREVNGYTYIDQSNSELKPTVSDVLHAWVQYWDVNRGWINIDPTWGATTGRDYFNQFDNDHIIFAMKGITSTRPLPAGSYRDENDNLQTVKVNLAERSDSTLKTFEAWLDNYTFERLPWWKRWWLRVTGQWVE